MRPHGANSLYHRHRHKIAKYIRFRRKFAINQQKNRFITVRGLRTAKNLHIHNVFIQNKICEAQH